MEWRRALLGMVPQWVQPPPTCVWASITATRWPALASFMAAPSPAGPVPMTMVSKRRLVMLGLRLGSESVPYR